MRADTRTNARSKQIRSYAPFTLGMRSIDLSDGANYQMNLKTSQGALEKEKQTQYLQTLTVFTSIVYISGYVKADGTTQVLVFGETSSGIKLRVVEEDSTVITPTSDIVYVGTVVCRQIGTKVLITQGSTSYSWDGTTVTAIPSGGGAPAISMARDGSRIGYITGSGANFTDTTPLDGFSNGTGANAGNNYNCGIAVPRAIIEGGTGVIILGIRGAEAHWVQPNAASDEVSSKTKIESFSYQGIGVTSERFVVSTGQSLIFMNEEGIFEMNVFTGQTVNLIKGGKIERYWNEQVDMSNGFVVYDQDSGYVLCQIALDSAVNNAMIAINMNEQGRSPAIISEQYLGCAGIVGGKLIGGNVSNSKLYQLFANYAVPEGTKSKARYITEFDGLGAIQSQKILQSVTMIGEVSPAATLKMRAYFDGETTPSMEKVITTKDLTSLEEDATYGEYTFAMGASDLVQEGVIRGEKKIATTRFHTIAIEIIEESADKFKIYDIIVMYKPTGRMSPSMSLKNNLF